MERVVRLPALATPRASVLQCGGEQHRGDADHQFHVRPAL